MLEAPSSQQLILGTDKRNPVISIYEDNPRSRLHVYYGFELMEVVPKEREAPAFKLMVGRLYNAGVNGSMLCATFDVDRKTMQRWGRALRSGDPEQLVRVLAGRSWGRKLTPEIQAYVRTRWPVMQAERRSGCSVRLCREIQTVFGVELSTETLRPLLGCLKAEQAPGRAASPAAAGPPSACSLEVADAVEKTDRPGEVSAMPAVSVGSADALGWDEERETSWGSKVSALPPSEPAVKPTASESEAVSPRGVAVADKPKGSPALAPYPPGQTRWCDHVGVLLFWTSLIQAAGVVDPPEPLFAQWLASLWLGAVNIEQTKYLNWEDLELLLDTVVRFPTPQRDRLQRLAQEENLGRLLRLNSRLLPQEAGTDFYFDPHTKHYTGEQNVLKGWCPGIRSADKAVHSDFVHTVRGEPIYFETTDNFEDLRVRFFTVADHCRQVLEWPPERVVSWVVDRGIFGAEVFEKILADPARHLITWQKGYVAEEWPAPPVSGRLVMERARNDATDLRPYHFEYVDRDWAPNPPLRQLVVRATNPRGQSIQVAILTDDRQRAAPEIIRLMFHRWIQENDFKYLDKHFGINQLTSYRAIPYEKLQAQLTDREQQSGRYKALRQQQRQWQAQQARLLLVHEQCEHKARRRQRELTELERRSVASEAEAAATLRPQIGRLQAAQKHHEQRRGPREKQIQDWSQKLSGLEVELAAVAGKVSRVQALIEADMVRMEPRCKRLMDTLKIIARNAFYVALAPFKRTYNNYRDDHDYFRQLTQANGVLEVRPETITVHLMPKVNYSPRLQRLIRQLLEEVNGQQPQMPDGTQRALRFRLGSRSEMRLSLEISAPESQG